MLYVDGTPILLVRADANPVAPAALIAAAEAVDADGNIKPDADPKAKETIEILAGQMAAAAAELADRPNAPAPDDPKYPAAVLNLAQAKAHAAWAEEQAAPVERPPGEGVVIIEGIPEDWTKRRFFGCATCGWFGDPQDWRFGWAESPVCPRDGETAPDLFAPIIGDRLPLQLIDGADCPAGPE